MKKQLALWKKYADQQSIEQINKMNSEQLKDAFGQELNFGTSGIRAVMAPGPSNFNIYTIIKATYGYAKYLMAKYGDTKPIKVIIGTDNRKNNQKFAQISAEILSHFNIISYQQLIVPTPYVSFVIKNLKAQGGIVITASHNPKEYNGYKVYDQNGAQLLPSETNKVLAYTKERDEYLTFKYQKRTELIKLIPNHIFNDYQKALSNLTINFNSRSSLKVVFSSLHGTSKNFILPLLIKLGHQVIQVKEQMSFDPYFKNAKSSNPEDPNAYKLGLEYLKKTKSDILILTDPDADRIGVMALDKGKWKLLSGNQLATIIFAYLIENLRISNKHLLLSSIVSSDLPEVIAHKNMIQSIRVDTGFKWIAQAITKNKDDKFLFGFEESFGCLLSSKISSDKDAMQAAVLVTEIASWAKVKKQTLWDILAKIYEKYGYYFEINDSLKITSNLTIKKLINQKELIFQEVGKIVQGSIKKEDYTKGLEGIAPTNLFKFIFKEGWIAIRPSGTEPKIKFYASANSDTFKRALANKRLVKNYLELIKDKIFELF